MFVLDDVVIARNFRPFYIHLTILEFNFGPYLYFGTLPGFKVQNQMIFAIVGFNHVISAKFLFSLMAPIAFIAQFQNLPSLFGIQ